MNGNIIMTARFQSYGWKLLSVVGIVELIGSMVAILQGSVPGVILFMIAGFTIWEGILWWGNAQKHQKGDWQFLGWIMGGSVWLLLLLDNSPTPPWVILLWICWSVVYISRGVYEKFSQRKILAGYLLLFGILSATIAVGGLFKDLEWVIPLGLISTVMMGAGTWLLEGFLRGFMRFSWALGAMVAVKIAHTIYMASFFEPDDRTIMAAFMFVVATIFAIAAGLVAGVPSRSNTEE